MVSLSFETTPTQKFTEESKQIVPESDQGLFCLHIFFLSDLFGSGKEITEEKKSITSLCTI